MAGAAWSDLRPRRTSARDERTGPRRADLRRPTCPSARACGSASSASSARVLKMPAREIGATLRRHRYDLLTPVTIKTGISALQQRTTCRNAPTTFPASTCERPRCATTRIASWRRTFSATSARSRKQQLDALAKQGYRSGDTIGQTGIESQYDKYLRGTPGLAVKRVDSLGRQQGPTTPARAAAPGQHRPADGRPEAADGGGRGAALRDRARAQLRLPGLLVLERRCDRRAWTRATDRSARSRRTRRTALPCLSDACASVRSTPRA